jgi:hypothetical protein
MIVDGPWKRLPLAKRDPQIANLLFNIVRVLRAHDTSLIEVLQRRRETWAIIEDMLYDIEELHRQQDR